MMILFLHSCIVGWLLYNTRWFKLPGVSDWMAPVMIAVKMGMGFLLSWYYIKTYNGGDMHGYLSEGMAFRELWQNNPLMFFKVMLGLDDLPVTDDYLTRMPIWFDNDYGKWFNDARTFIRFNAVLSLFSNGVEGVHLLWLNVLSVGGCWMLFRFFFGINPSSENKVPLLALLVLLLPNVLIWSSGILKEPLMLFFMGLMLRYYQRFQWWGKRSDGVLFVLGVAGFFLLKIYFMAIFLPVFLVWPFLKNNEGGWKKLVGVYALLLVLVLVAGLFIPALDLPARLFGQQLNMWRYSVYMDAGSVMQPLAFAPNPWSFLRHIPGAFLFSMLLPGVMNQENYIAIPMLLESVSVLLLMAFTLGFAVKYKLRVSVEASVGLLTGLAIVIICGYTTVVLGTLVRYRMPGLLLLVLSMFAILWSGRITISSRK